TSKELYGVTAPLARHTGWSAVNHTPTNPFAKLPEPIAIWVSHNDHARFSVPGNAYSLATVIVDDLHIPADDSLPGLVEDQSAFGLIAARTHQYMVLVPLHHFGIVLSNLYQAHFSAAWHASHCTNPTFKNEL